MYQWNVTTLWYIWGPFCLVPFLIELLTVMRVCLCNAILTRQGGERDEKDFAVAGVEEHRRYWTELDGRRVECWRIWSARAESRVGGAQCFGDKPTHSNDVGGDFNFSRCPCRHDNVSWHIHYRSLNENVRLVLVHFV